MWKKRVEGGQGGGRGRIAQGDCAVNTRVDTEKGEHSFIETERSRLRECSRGKYLRSDVSTIGKYCRPRPCVALEEKLYGVAS